MSRPHPTVKVVSIGNRLDIYEEACKTVQELWADRMEEDRQAQYEAVDLYNYYYIQDGHVSD